MDEQGPSHPEGKGNRLKDGVLPLQNAPVLRVEEQGFEVKGLLGSHLSLGGFDFPYGRVFLFLWRKSLDQERWGLGLVVQRSE